MLREIVDALLLAQDFDISVFDVAGEPEFSVADVQHVCFGAEFVFLAGELGLLRVFLRIVLEILCSVVELLYLIEAVGLHNSRQANDLCRIRFVDTECDYGGNVVVVVVA
jgi:hypothetical protein